MTAWPFVLPESDKLTVRATAASNETAFLSTISGNALYLRGLMPLAACDIPLEIIQRSGPKDQRCFASQHRRCYAGKPGVAEERSYPGNRSHVINPVRVPYIAETYGAPSAYMWMVASPGVGSYLANPGLTYRTPLGKGHVIFRHLVDGQTPETCLSGMASAT